MSEKIDGEQSLSGNSSKAADEVSVCFPLYIFTRTPLHVGAGASVGAIDLPIQRERHTGFPILPGSTLKGVFADSCNERSSDGGISRSTKGKCLFGSDDSNGSAAGALQFSEAKLLAFPIRSAKGCFAWITSPIVLKRYARDLGEVRLFERLPELKDDEALFRSEVLGIDGKLVLEEYVFAHAGDPSSGIGEALAALLPDDPIWEAVGNRIVVLSDASVSFFVRSACEVAQHVKIDDRTGTAQEGALFNQENVPAETMFYALVRASWSRSADAGSERRTAREVWQDFREIIEKEKGIFQFGADAGTGLGFCTVRPGEEMAS